MSSDQIWNDAIDAAAIAAAALNKTGREWVHGSFWDILRKETAADILKLKRSGNGAKDDQARAQIVGSSGGSLCGSGGGGASPRAS